MNRVLITAFEPYGEFKQNASWLALVELTKDLPTDPEVTTRLYPVDFAAMEARLRADLEYDFDFAIHVGQAPGSTQVLVENIAVNVAQGYSSNELTTRQLVPDGPTAFQTRLPVETFVQRLRLAGIPACVSFHAGTYLCNGIFYMSQFLSDQCQLRTQSVFVHVPLATSQVASEGKNAASLSVAATAQALGLILEEVARLKDSKELA